MKKEIFCKQEEKLNRRKLKTSCKKCNSKKRKTSLTLGEDKLLALAVQKYPCFYDKNHRSHKEKMQCKNAWEAVADELNFVEDGKNFCCFRCFY